MVDAIIDHYIKVRKRKNFPKKIVEPVLKLVFPESHYIGRGFHKVVHAIYSRSFKRVIKISNFKSTNRDWDLYHRLPRTIRNLYFAKIYWHTKYCSLQKFGRKAVVPQVQLEKLKRRVKQYGLTDVRAENIRKFGKGFKIIDAYPART